MGRALFSIISLIALAVLIVLNINSTASFNLFGWQFEELAVPVLAIVSFVLGAFYTFLFYLSGYFSRLKKRKLERQKEKLKSQGQSVRQENQKLRTEKKSRDKDSVQPRTVPQPRRQASIEDRTGSAQPNVIPDRSTAASSDEAGSAKEPPRGKKRGLKRFFGASSK